MTYGRGDLSRALDGGNDLLDDAARLPAPGKHGPEDLARDLEKMGPTFIKVGQLLSTRADLLPPTWMEGLSRLQDDVEPVPFGLIEEVVVAELGARISKAFASFCSQPMAAASLGQVHEATLRDGRPVAVKVQRPGIRERVVEDLEALGEIAHMLSKHSAAGRRWQLVPTFEEMRHTLLEELDYRREERNLASIGASLAEFDSIVVPRPIAGYVTSRVLTMELVDGRKVTDIEPLVRLDLDGRKLASQLFEAYLKQILVDGLFHADPHPGNVLVTPDGRVGLIDLGMVGRVSPELQTELVRLLLSVAEGHGEEAADRAAALGEKGPGFDPGAFRRKVSGLVAAVRNATVGEMQVGRLLLDVSRAAADTSVRMPSAFTMLGKTLLNLDQVGRALDPNFDPNAAIRQHAARLLEERMRQSASTGNLVTALLESKELVEKLPARANRLLDLISRNELKLKVDAFDEDVFLEGLQKVANRITLGLVVAALIVGAAMLMRVPTTFRILGYPGFAILFFLFAASGGVALVASILASDRKASR